MDEDFAIPPCWTGRVRCPPCPVSSQVGLSGARQPDIELSTIRHQRNVIIQQSCTLEPHSHAINEVGKSRRVLSDAFGEFVSIRLYYSERMLSASGHCNPGKKEGVRSGTRIDAHRLSKPMTTKVYADKLKVPVCNVPSRKPKMQPRQSCNCFIAVQNRTWVSFADCARQYHRSGRL